MGLSFGLKREEGKLNCAKLVEGCVLGKLDWVVLNLTSKVWLLEINEGETGGVAELVAETSLTL